MELVQRHRVAAAPERLQQVLRSPARLASCLPVREVRVDGPEVELLIEGPRPLRLRLLVEPTPAGIAWSLVEGDVSALSGSIGVEPCEDGSLVSWRLALDPGVVIPGPLLRELEHEVLPRWSAALADALDGLETTSDHDAGCS